MTTCMNSCIFGVEENGLFIGCVLFGRVAPWNHRFYSLKRHEAIELTRVALRKHITPVSRILRIAISMLRDGSPGLRVISSFADPSIGHHGGIYQAGNWYYLGMTPTKQTIAGRHNRVVVSQLVRCNAVHPGVNDHRIIVTPSKHRYAYPLDKSMRERLEAMKQPYPRRKHRGDAPTCHVGKGGSNPTPALQSKPVRP